MALEESGRLLFAVHRNGWWLVCLGEGEAGVVVWVMVIYLDYDDDEAHRMEHGSASTLSWTLIWSGFCI